MKHAIQLTNVVKRFGSNTALNNVSIDVPTGTVFALLGENGAGKTTAIRTMLGLVRPDSGDATVLGMSSATQGLEIRRRIGYVPEQPVLYDWMTVDEIGWFTAGFYGDDFLPRYRSLANEFNLPSSEKLKSLSKGMRAKVGLSLSLAHEPDLLILDEPTSGLDTLVRREFLNSMVDIAAAGRTVFLSSHQIPEVERVADIVAIINQGTLLVCEPLDELKQRLEQWTVTMEDAASPPPDVSASVLLRQQQMRQWQLLVSEPAADSLDQLRNNDAVLAVETHSPSLEEIFVAYLQFADVKSVAADRAAIHEGAES